MVPALSLGGAAEDRGRESKPTGAASEKKQEDFQNRAGSDPLDRNAADPDGEKLNNANALPAGSPRSVASGAVRGKGVFSEKLSNRGRRGGDTEPRKGSNALEWEKQPLPGIVLVGGILIWKVIKILETIAHRACREICA